ncbi:Glutamate Aspartate transport system permease protein GltK (TC 3.A.1.3.4) [Cronobacter universalis NCTC 9529]|nr:Glutamate Aspartate transport system permease protein GltK (TC 3.A.1.3.4) [Cronobacter universalis NCTC 9529]
MTTNAISPAPARPVNRGALVWMRKNLFSSWSNSLLTLFCLWMMWELIPPLLNWAFFQANWVGSTRADCTKEGACWVFIHARFGQFMYGLYPHNERWRINLALIIGLVSIVPIFWKSLPQRGRYIACWAIAYPVVVWWLLYGGFLGLERVETRQWGGLTLTLIIASVGIAGALPLGILLALGRRSRMPVVRVLSVIFIEFWRGVPLITVLFMSSVMLPLFMAEGTSIAQAYSRAGRGNSVPVRLCGGSGAWWVTGAAQGPVRGRGITGAGLLENAGAGDPAAGAEACDTGSGQYHHRPF